MVDQQDVNVVDKQKCPMCNKNSLTLMETERDVPYFGKIFIFSMDCDSCKYHKADVEAAELKEPCKYTFEIESEEDLKVRIVRSSNAIIKLPHLTTIEPGTTSNGYVTNIEGILNRVKFILEGKRDNSDDAKERKQAKNLLKKLTKIMWGQQKQKLIIEDKTGNSAIISDKAVFTKLK